jgi:hypothetical protein
LATNRFGVCMAFCSRGCRLGNIHLTAERLLVSTSLVAAWPR